VFLLALAKTNLV